MFYKLLNILTSYLRTFKLKAMKTKSFLLVVFSMFLSLFIISCGDDEDDGDVIVTPTGIVVDNDSLSIAVEGSDVLIASLEPEGAVGEITWSSSDPSVAVVNDGVVTALEIGETTVVASYGVFSASCVVTVTAKEIDPNDLPSSLSGSDYAIIQIDENSYEAIKDKVIYDFRPDDDITNLYVWDGTFVAGTASGLNFYEQTEDWVSLVVSSVGWSGAGYNVASGFGDIDLSRFNDNPEDYVFHIALKSAQENTSFLMIFSDGQSEAKVCVGPSSFVDGEITYEPYTDFSRDNEWHSVEIPLSYLQELGLFYDQPFSDVNIFAFLAGGVAGTTLDMDAVFFYKKAE